MLPVYEMGRRRGITTAEAIDILLRSTIPSSKVSQDVPTSIAKNLLFVVDLEAPHVKTVNNLLADDMSAWHGMGTKTFFFQASHQKKTVDQSLTARRCLEPLVYIQVIAVVLLQ